MTLDFRSFRHLDERVDPFKEMSDRGRAWLTKREALDRGGERLLLRSLPSSYNLSSRGPVSLFAKTKANFPARKDALLARIASVEAELGVVVAQAKAERATSVEVKTQADELVRQRALALISLRKTNRAIDELRKTGAQIPVDLASVSGGFAPWGSLLLGHAGNVGIGGKAARGYLVAVFNAGLLSRAELEEDS